MLRHALLTGFSAAVVTVAAPSFTAAAPIALYTFEEQAASFSTTAVGTSVIDVSGNGLDFTKGGAAGTLSWTNDLASVQPTGTTSLFYNAAGALDTPTHDWSFATNPTLTMEFWYKPDLTDTLRWLLDTGDGANSWALFQEVPGNAGAPAGRSNLEFSYIDDNGTVRGINTATSFDASSPWTHVAVSVDRVSGDIAIYFDGVEDTATAGTNEGINGFAFASKISTLRMGQINTAGSFSNRFYIDDLRISDEILLPGAGTGNGELAWNATLIPEPGSLTLLACGAMLIARRRR